MKSGTPVVMLNETEQKAMDSLIDYIRETQTWGNKANLTEFIAAVHVLQGFIVQHMLHRLEPTKWSNWYSEPEKP